MRRESRSNEADPRTPAAPSNPRHEEPNRVGLRVPVAAVVGEQSPCGVVRPAFPLDAGATVRSCADESVRLRFR